MKRITIKKMELKNFKNHSSLTVDFPSSGLGSIVVSGHNGSGKSSILEAVIFALGGSVEAGKVLNQSTKAPASVSLTIEHPEGTDTFTRTLTPTLDANGKVTASTSSYVISGVPKKKTEYDIRVNQLFGTKDWQYLLRPEMNAFNKDARSILLAVAGCPSEKEFLQGHNVQLASIIGNTSFDDFEKREKAIIQNLGKKIDAIPGRIEENAAMLQPVEEIDLTGVEDRIKVVNSELSGVDQINSQKQADYEKTSKEAQSLRNEATRLRGLANEKVMEENKRVNQAAFDAEIALQAWKNEKAKLTAQYDAVKSEIAEARTDLARAEARAQELYAEAMQHAEAHKQTSLRPIDSEKLGQCQICQKWCGDLAARGAEAAEKQRTDELARIVEAGKQVMSLRGKELAKINEITDRIDSLMSQEHEAEKQFAEMPPMPVVPFRKTVESTEESRHLEQQATDLEATASKLIQSNRLDIMQRPTELVLELQNLNEKLTRGAAARQTQKNNEKINARIAELREEESKLIFTQLEHKQHIAQLKEFYKQYAESVTASVNKMFDGTGCEIRLFESNMGNDKGVPVMQPMKEGNTNLCRSEAVIFGKFFVERVLSKYWNVLAPMLLDDTESLDSVEKLRSNHQVIAARVERHELEITNIE